MNSIRPNFPNRVPTSGSQEMPSFSPARIGSETTEWSRARLIALSVKSDVVLELGQPLRQVDVVVAHGREAVDV